jgi:hypothetical protein
MPPLEESTRPGLVARVAGFSLHAGTVCAAFQRKKLERLCRYLTRPPIATQRLAVDAWTGTEARGPPTPMALLRWD